MSCSLIKSIWIVFLLGLGQSVFSQSSSTIEVANDSIIAFENVAVISMHDTTVLEGQTVLIQGDRIISVEHAHSSEIPPAARIIDGSNHYLIPGLADMHVHVNIPFEDGPLFLNSGITTIHSLGTRTSESTEELARQKILQERANSRLPGYAGPTLYTVGPMINGGETPEQVERIVRHNAKYKYDMVKVHGDVSPEAFDRLNETANELGIKVTGHAQRNQGMKPVYEHKQDIVHIEEYIYTAFNPNTNKFRFIKNGSILSISLLIFINIIWGLWIKKGKGAVSIEPLWYPQIKKGLGRYTAISLLFIFGLALVMTYPFPSLFAGQPIAMVFIAILMLIVGIRAAQLTIKVVRGWNNTDHSIETRTFTVLLLCLAWFHISCSSILTVRTWNTTDANLTRIAQETSSAGIWVTPNLVAWDYIVRQSGDEFQSLIQRPGMKYLKPDARNRWINNNWYRQFPEFMGGTQVMVRGSYGKVATRLTTKLHEAKVPLLAGTDVGIHGVLTGSSLHEELYLMTEAGLTPYEALKTATINPAIYLGAEQEFGRIEVGLRADLVLLAANPLVDIENTRTRVGVMKHGQWFSAKKLEAALTRIAEERK